MNDTFRLPENQTITDNSIPGSVTLVSAPWSMFEPEKKCMVVELESKIDYLSKFCHAFKYVLDEFHRKSMR